MLYLKFNTNNTGVVLMQGSVIWINPENSEDIKICFDEGRIVKIELLGAEVEIGDIISGDFTDLGGGTMYNSSKLEYIDVYVQDFD